MWRSTRRGALAMFMLAAPPVALLGLPLVGGCSSGATTGGNGSGGAGGGGPGAGGSGGSGGGSGGSGGGSGGGTGGSATANCGASPVCTSNGNRGWWTVRDNVGPSSCPRWGLEPRHVPMF